MVWYRYPHGPASFEMEWKILDGGFVELNFTNAFVDASGAVAPVLQARALYRPSGTTAIGVWIDTRPQRIQLESEISQSAVITPGRPRPSADARSTGLKTEGSPFVTTSRRTARCDSSVRLTTRE